jgi:hypothetical protein
MTILPGPNRQWRIGGWLETGGGRPQRGLEVKSEGEGRCALWRRFSRCRPMATTLLAPLLLVRAPLALPPAHVTVHRGAAAHPVSEATNGCHFSPLDHQLFHVYSQMVYDESFEQSISDGKPNSKVPGVNVVSLGWSNISRAPGILGGARWIDNATTAFNGNASVRLTMESAAPVPPSSSHSHPPPAAHHPRLLPLPPRVGIAARGLYHQGYQLHAGREYSGYLAVKAERAASVHVRLEDWGTDRDPSAWGQAPVPLAHVELRHPGGGRWEVLNFTMVPAAETHCAPFPFGQQPLDCGIPNSQQSMPPSFTGTCKVCGGTLTVAVEEVGTVVDIDQVFLEPGAWGRYRGLHMHKLAAEWLLAMGTRMVRYGGTFTQTVQGLWKSSR